MKVRHPHLRSEEVLTRLGSLKLDEGGVVTNLEELGIRPEEVLKLPEFVDADLFPPSPNAYKKVETESSKDKEPETDNLDQHKELLRKLLAAGTKMNSEGYIDMPTFLDALKEAKLPSITGAQRKELQDSLRNEA